MKIIFNKQSSFMQFIKRIFALPFFPAFFLLAVCLMTYLPTLHNGFKYDDFTHMDIKAPSWASLFAQFSKTSTQHYNPLDPILNDFLFSLWGKNVVPFHILNILLMYLNLLCLFRIALILTHARLVSLLAAVLFCLHPINAEIVNQVVFNSVLLSALFFQLSFIFYDRYLCYEKFKDILSAFLFALISFLFLETSWLLAGYLFCWAYFYKRKSFKYSFFLTFPFAVITVVLFVLWRFLCAAGSISLGISTKFEYLGLTCLTFLGSLCKLVLWYFTKLFIPINHIWIYSISPISQMESLLNLLILFIALGLVFWGFRRLGTFRQISFASFWFIACFLFLIPGSLAHPEVGLVIEPYWFFISSLGFFILIAFFLFYFKFIFSRIFFILLLSSICLTLFCVAQRFNVIAKSEKSYSEYWLNIVLNPMPLNAVGNHAFQSKEYNKAINYYEIYLKRFAISPYAQYSLADIYTKLALIYSEMGNIKNAKVLIAKALKINKNHIDARITSGLISLNEKDYNQAEINFLEVIKVDPNSTISRLNLVDIYHLTQQDQKAIDILKFLTQQDLSIDDRRNVYSRLAVLQFIHQGFAHSFETVSELLLEDQSGQSYLALAQNFETFGFYEPALILLEQGIRLYPKNKELKFLLEKIVKRQNNSAAPAQRVFNNK